jgi:small subunit ribosomal protein S2
VDVLKEKIAIAEARKLNIPTFAMVDTNSDPTIIDFPIPANDDASKSIEVVVRIMVKAIEEGLAERKMDKERKEEEEREEEEARAKVKSKTIEEYEEQEDEEAEKGQLKTEKPVKMKDNDTTGPDKGGKRKRTISKKK